MSISETNALDAIAIANDARQGERILDNVYKFTGRFVAYPSEATHVAHTLWIAHTHLMNRWESTPRLAFLSPEPASGKSRALEVTEPLVPFPMEAVNVSASSLFRSIGNREGLPTILYDEVDTVFGPRTKDNNEDIRGLLNAGHHKGAKAYRSVLNGKQVAVEAIEVYCPVALAGLGWLPDTLLSRSIIVRMRRRHKGEQVEAFRRRVHRVEGQGLRERLGVWARSLPEPEWPELPAEIQDRAADCWEPLIAVADAAGGSWPARARSAALALVAERSDAEPSLGIRLLSDLRSVFGDQDELTSKAILAALHALPESPWADIKGKPLDERGLAHRLRNTVSGLRPSARAPPHLEAILKLICMTCGRVIRPRPPI